MYTAFLRRYSDDICLIDERSKYLDETFCFLKNIFMKTRVQHKDYYKKYKKIDEKRDAALEGDKMTDFGFTVTKFVGQKKVIFPISGCCRVGKLCWNR